MKKLQNSRNQGFSYYFFLTIEGSRSGSVPLTNRSGSRRPKHIRIRIRNTVDKGPHWEGGGVASRTWVLNSRQGIQGSGSARNNVRSGALSETTDFHLELVVVNPAALAGGLLGGGRLIVAHIHLLLLLVLYLLALGRLGSLLKPHHQLDNHNLTDS